ncbi:MAG: cytochrome P450, partial [Pseudonocardiaceae bacterium]
GAAFSPKIVTGLAPRIAELTRELLDATGSATEFDLAATLAYPLPMSVIAELLGLPACDRDLFGTWADRLVEEQVTDPTDPGIDRRIDDATADMLTYLHEHCRDRRAHPTQDLISELAAVNADGERLSDEEVVNFSLLLLPAGHITTTALLGNTVLCLDERPDILAELHTDPSLIPATIEEVLRYRCPFTYLGRVTMVDTELAGQIIPADALVTPWPPTGTNGSSPTPTDSISTAPPTTTWLSAWDPLLHRPAIGQGGGQSRGGGATRPLRRHPAEPRGTPDVL